MGNLKNFISPLLLQICFFLMTECITMPSPSLVADRSKGTDVVLNVTYIQVCCDIVVGDDLTSNERLMACVGRMSQYSRNSLQKSTSSVSGSYISANDNIHSSDSLGRKSYSHDAVVALVSLIPKNVFELHSSSMAINAAYAEHNHYLFYAPSQLPEFSKQRNVLMVLKDVSGQFSQSDFVFWINDDYVITDVSWRMEDMFTAADSDIDVIIVQDELREGLNPFQQNTSCILFRNTAWALQFFFMFDLFVHYNEEDLALKKKNHLTSFLATVPPEDARKVKVLPSSLLHASYPSHVFQKQGLPILQLVGEDHMYARSVFDKGWSEICGHTKRHNLHKNPAPFPVSKAVTPIYENMEPPRDPVWSFIDSDEVLSTMSSIEQFAFSLPDQLGLSQHALRLLFHQYQRKYSEIKSLVGRAKQLTSEKGGENKALPYKAINQIYRSTVAFNERQHPSIVAKSNEDIVFLHLWCYASFRDAFLVPVMNIESDQISSDINDLKAAVIEIFRTLFEVLFQTVKLLAADKSRKSVRLNIVNEAEQLLLPRIKMFFYDSNLNEGYYLTFRLLSLLPDVEKKRKAAEYWYYVFESSSYVLDDDGRSVDVAYSHSEVDDWINFFCSLGDTLRKSGVGPGSGVGESLVRGGAASVSGGHGAAAPAAAAAAVKYYGTGIDLLRTMIRRRSNATATGASAGGHSASSRSLLGASQDKAEQGRLQLASALLGRVLCSSAASKSKDVYYTLEAKLLLEETKRADLTESRDIFASFDAYTLSVLKKGRYEEEYVVASRTLEQLEAALLSSAQASSAASPVAPSSAKKIFKRKKIQKKQHDMLKPTFL